MTDADKKKKDEEVDRASEESMDGSDPPSFTPTAPGDPEDGPKTDDKDEDRENGPKGGS